MKKLLFLVACLMTVIGCQNDKPTYYLNATEQSINSREALQLVVKGEAETVAHWSSQNEFIATVNQNGFVKAMHVGETTINCQIGKETLFCRIIVTPIIILYDEPILKFGASLATIKSEETRTLVEETPETLTYADSKCIGVIYKFESNMMTSVVTLLSPTISLDDIWWFLVERYIREYTNNIHRWTNSSVAVEMNDDINAYIITYTPREISQQTINK